ncbi:MAG: hypothetical protein NUV77_24835, partial [Thermoguttaceae bacterium]|nr:hypothetical protein [Thermoguttaceae bacterium]
PAHQARWEREQPDAPFITIAPLHLREAFWTKIARPIRGIMYHGWQSLVPTDSPSGYRYTHPETQHELARLVREVVQPLGPTLLAVPGASSDVAFLESFASQVFARRGTYGWGGGWLGDAYHVLLYAHLQPEIVYDETVAQRGLDGFRVLVMADCDVLTASVARRVKEFQARGGIVVGDERLAPAIKPDILMNSYQRTGRADRDKQALLALAAELRGKLDGRYRRGMDSSNPEVVPYLRRWREAQYVFVVSDRREYGRYVGHHGIVMENGLPCESVLSVERPEGFVYDLVRHENIPVRKQDGRLLWDVRLGPCDGGVYLVSPRPIAGLRIIAPESVGRGLGARCVVEVVDPEGRPVDAVVPVEVTIRDAEGRTAEFSGSYAAVGGRLEVSLDIAANDPPGAWRIEARELASGRGAQADLRVRGLEERPSPGVPSKETANPVQPRG